ncbi:MAG: polymer-forming cytoskeletal protein [Phycisphaerae bacterium]|jgi:hypothetical protein
MPSNTTKRRSAVKQVICTECGRPSEVPLRAMSVFCPHCKQRLILENFKIKTYYAVSNFSTFGDIVVERKGHVVAPVKAGTLTIKGKLQGRVTVREKASIHKTAWFKGDLTAPSLRVEPGAVLDGFLRIGPNHSAELQDELRTSKSEPRP